MDIPHKSIQTKQPNTLTDAIHILTQMQSDDDIEVLNAVMQFSMLLSIASEESFLTLPIDHTITTLMYCVGRSLPDIGLYAIMCLNHILDTVPNSSHLLVSQGGVGVLCRLLLNLEYIDMAEHAVKCLERIAHDTPSALVREGVFPVMINILDFFEESTQKKIMATSVIISKAISTEEILNNNILPSLPEMSNLLVYRGLGNVWKPHLALQFYLGLTESIFKFSRLDRVRLRNNMENICRYGAFQNAVELIKENMEFQHLVFRFLKVVCSTSPYLVVMFHNISGLHLIKQALETEEKNISENHTFLTETIQLIDVLIPNKSLNDVFGKELDEIYRLSPDLLRNLGEMTLPRLVKIYDKILNKNLKNSILLVIGKLFSVAETDAIINYINHPHFSAFLFGVFRSKEQEVLRSGLKLVMLLYEKCPVQIAESFVRDGIIYKIQNLKNQEKTQIESPIKEKPRLIRSNAMRDSDDLITLESQDYKRYRNFRRSYMVYKENEDNKMMILLPKDMIDMINTIISKSQSFEKPDFFNILNQLKTISRSLNDTENDCSTALVKFRELTNTKESISLYEFINSEFIEALYKWLTNGYKKNPVLVSKRIYEFMSLFLENSSAGISYLNGLITLLLKSIRYSQEFSILLYETIAGFSNSFHAMRTLGSRVRIKLVYSPDGYQSNPDCLELENKHKLFSSIGAVSLSLEQFVSLETITDALLNVKTLESIEFLTESFENSNNEPKHLNPDQFNMIRQHLKMQLVLSESSDLNSALEDMGIRSEGNEHLIDEIQTQKRLIDNKDIEEDMIDVDQPIEAMNISTQKSSRFDEAKLRVLFKINGTHLHKKMTLFEIINKHEIDETLTINFQFTLEKNKENENSTYVMSGNGVLDEIIKNSRLLMIEADNKAYPALRLLKLLYLLNQNLRYIMSPCSILFPFPVSLSLHPNLDRANFTSHKLSSLLSKQTSDMLAMIGGMAPDWIINLSKQFPNLLDFNQRYEIFKVIGFGSDRSMHYYSNKGKAFSIRMLRQKAMIPRDNLLEAGYKVIGDSELLRYGMLEFDFVSEEGTGVGPTLEFYSLISEEIRRLDIWRSPDDPDGLFPAPILTQNVDRVSQIFNFLGKLVAKAIYDDKLINLKLSPVFWKLVLKKPVFLPDLARVDRNLGTHLIQFQEQVNQLKWIHNEFSDPDYIYKNLKQVKFKGSSISDLHLNFTLPGYDEIELKPNGKKEIVSLETLEEYITLVAEFTLLQNYQAEMFRKGFEKLIPVNCLEVFEPDELESVICGKDEEIWDSSMLLESILPAHGYNKDSRTFQNLVDVLANFDLHNRQLFLKFCTGSPRLPLGGFKGLHPALTVVKKDPNVLGSSPDIYLPSVMTCQNYLKVPDYTSKEILIKQLKYALNEGNEAFHFS